MALQSFIAAFAMEAWGAFQVMINHVRVVKLSNQFMILTVVPTRLKSQLSSERESLWHDRRRKMCTNRY